jgi:hypothetical protein
MFILFFNRRLQLRRYHPKKIAQIVDEADTVQEVFLEPVAPGLDFICDGISLSSEDDYEALEKGFNIYEALYAMIKRNNN